ncbi:MAG: iron-sulfur cluster assembly accessory protein [Rickettsiales bacterium]
MINFNFKVTDSAINQLLIIAKKYNHVVYKLKISVLGGGCAGFSYTYKLIQEKEKNDIEININNITILIDNSSAALLNNCTLNFIKTLGNQFFEIQRPTDSNSSKCGCGNSFNI